jgi:prophage DNA circulation protein
VAESAFYRSSFGGLRLWISQIQTDKSRRQVVHELSDGDGNVIEDKGPKPIVSRVSLLFDKMIGDSLAPLERLRAFAELVDDKPRIFSHPIEGTFLARVSDFSTPSTQVQPQRRMRDHAVGEPSRSRRRARAASRRPAQAPSRAPRPR